MHRHGYEQHHLFMSLGPLAFAVEVYKDRNTPTRDKEGKKVHSRKLGPRGFKVPWGPGGFWTPTVAEVQSCCKDIKAPGFKFGWVYYRHCCTATHIANLLDIEEDELRKLIFPPKKVTHKCSCGKFAPKGDYLCKSCRNGV